jgi:hypothetical protein
MFTTNVTSYIPVDSCTGQFVKLKITHFGKHSNHFSNIAMTSMIAGSKPYESREGFKTQVLQGAFVKINVLLMELCEYLRSIPKSIFKHYLQVKLV